MSPLQTVAADPGRKVTNEEEGWRLQYMLNGSKHVAAVVFLLTAVFLLTDLLINFDLFCHRFFLMEFPEAAVL
jgi:hypothetical protein